MIILFIISEFLIVMNKHYAYLALENHISGT